MLSFQQVESLKSAFGPQSTPLIEVLETMGNQVATKLSSELASKADIAEIKGSINTLREMSKRDIEELRGELKADILELKGRINTIDAELNGKIDSLGNELNGKFGSLEHELKGKIGSLEHELKGELKSIRLMMQTLIGLVILGVSFFSPVGLKLIEYAFKGMK
ncbi:MAG: DUF1640 domain-containing protein [Deltaproteobacteria bacterium]|nr:DUF1640 domain-containing protein [Deltaproteobacteria bacterium]